MVEPSYVLGPVGEVDPGPTKTCGLSVAWSDYCGYPAIIKICRKLVPV